MFSNCTPSMHKGMEMYSLAYIGVDLWGAGGGGQSPPKESSAGREIFSAPPNNGPRS